MTAMYMVRFILVGLLLVSGFGCLKAQMSVSKAFAEAPRELFPLLTDMTRLDMIDYYASGTRTASRNVLEGESRIEEMSPLKMKIKMSDVSEYVIAILPSKRDTVIAVVSTVMIPMPDSRLAFYNSDWEPSEKNRFTEPGLSQWLLPSAKAVRADVENAIPFVPATYSVDAATGELTVTHNLKDLLPEADYEFVKNYVRPALSYRWDGSRMKLVKK